MTRIPIAGPAAMLAFLFILLSAGCLTTTLGDAGYRNHSVIVAIHQASDPEDVHVQVTIYRVANMTQEQLAVVSAPATLARGENSVSVPVELAPGSYKLYIYVLDNGDRRTAGIRDIVV